MADTLDILVVEDDPDCTKAARVVLEPYKEVNPDYARDLTEAMQLIGSKRYNGVLLDLFFPERTGSGLKEKARELLREFEEDETLAYLKERVNSANESLQPLGLLVAKRLKQENTSFVFVSTAGFGHGMKTNPFYSLRKYSSKIGAQREFEWTRVDSEPPYRDIGMNQFIARDTYQQLQGKDFGEIRNKLREVSMNHPVYKGWTFEKFDNTEVTYWAIKLGLLQPVKGMQTYQAAFFALDLPFRPLKNRV
ncbi:response regulator [Candidatus Woesearchaeota archaeon]|nr:response regulator [Candidatus Woesearchaeota archaeon]